MTGMDLIALAPWAFLAAALAVICLRLRRSRRAAARRREPATPPHESATPPRGPVSPPSGERPGDR
jgi:uncharacterized membrane protein